MKQKYSPDILNCLANLSSDEVFTSPELANRMLDLLPQELFQSPKTRFLDPCSKSGVFLREITKRLLIGLEGQIPDLQERIDHVMTQQVFGIACTDLTAEMSRRTLYCSKQANGGYSVSTAFQDGQGNLLYERCHHTWNAQGRCEHCGASKGEYLRSDSRETYAYPFIHKSIKEIFHKNMQFDVIIGNPPYQMSDGSGNGAGAVPIYNNFVLQAQKLQPRYLIMIIPARWYSGGRNLDSFRDTMLHDNRIRVIHDYPISSDCFAGVQIEGGVCYFMWDRESKGKCKVFTHIGKVIDEQPERDLLEEGCESFIRNNIQIQILRKVRSKGFSTFMNLVSANDPFGYDVREKKSYKRIKPPFRIEFFKGASEFYYYGWQKDGIGYIDKKTARKGSDLIDKWKVYITQAYGMGNGYPTQVINKPFVGKPNSLCSETYILIGPFDDEQTAQNVITYINTRFFRFMVLYKKNTQHATQGVYQFVPLQDFSHPWTDEMLYKKYGLTEGEIAFIESMIRPME
jgi:site-specific DNA-methyltransferase (adenine-specific)